MNKPLEKLYSKSTKGKLIFWYMTLIDDGENSGYFVSSGQVGGKEKTMKPTVCVGKNVGKKNETSPLDQAKKEIESKYKDKKKKGYSLDIERAGVKDYIQAMLADDIYKHKNIDKLVFPCAIQFKLDGIRIIASRKGLFTRDGNEIFSLDHIKKDVFEIFKKNENLIFLDGEGYNHNFRDNFNAIASAIKKEKEDSISEEQSKLIFYNVYDGGFNDENEKFFKRSKKIKKILKEGGCESLITTPTYIVNSFEEIVKKNEEFVKQGYEGSIIRLDSVYEHKRSRGLLKMKKFFEEEFKLIDVLEGTGGKSGIAGSVVCEKDNGVQFNSNIMGNMDVYAKNLLANKGDFIGKMVTIRFPNYTPDGIPRFPYMKTVRDYE